MTRWGPYSQAGEEQQPMEVTDVAVAEVDVAPTSLVTLPSLTEASEVLNPEVKPPTEVRAAVARNGPGFPVLVEDGDGEVMEAVTTLLGPVEEADCHVESVSPSLPRLAPEATEATEAPVEGTEAPAATALPAPAPPCGIPEEGAAQVRKVRRRQLIMAPEIRLPALSRRNRKNTVT